jgi:hypothetical protein
LIFWIAVLGFKGVPETGAFSVEHAKRKEIYELDIWWLEEIRRRIENESIGQSWGAQNRTNFKFEPPPFT